MSNSCVICEKETTFLDRRKIANKEVLCAGCLDSAKTLTPKQLLKLKSLTADDIRDSIVKSGGSLKKPTPPTFEVLEDPKNPTVKCTKCNSFDIQFMQNNKKAFSVGKAAGGAILTGGVGTLAGFAGKKGDDQWRCNNCGHIFSTAPKK